MLPKFSRGLLNSLAFVGGNLVDGPRCRLWMPAPALAFVAHDGGGHHRQGPNGTHRQAEATDFSQPTAATTG